MIDVEKEIKEYSLEKLNRYPNDIFLIKYGDDTIGTFNLKYGDETLWTKTIKYLNKLKTEST